MIYAIIENNIVSNIISLLRWNEGDFPNAIRCDEIYVSIGDSYNEEENRFYHNGEPIFSKDEIIKDYELYYNAMKEAIE